MKFGQFLLEHYLWVWLLFCLQTGCSFQHYFLKSKIIPPSHRSDANQQHRRQPFFLILRYPIFLNLNSDDYWDSSIAPKLDFEECYYAVLEVPPSIDFAGLKKAYHKLVFKYHPDRKTDPRAIAVANNQMKVINYAYTILRNTETREQYDRQRAKGLYGVNAKIHLADTNAADRPPSTTTPTTENPNTTGKKSTASPRTPPPPASTKNNARSSTDPSQIDIEKIRKNVEQVWGSYLNSKQGGKSNTASSSSSSPSTGSSGSRFNAPSGSFSNTEAALRAETKRRKEEEERMKNRLQQMRKELEYEAAEEDSNEIYAAIFKIRGSAYNMNSIKNGLLYLYRLKDQKINSLKQDQRDWGTVTSDDEVAVYRRLKSLEALKAITALISELEEKLRIVSRSFGHSDDGDEWNDLWQDEQEERRRSYRDYRDYSPPNQPQPQPQPQKIRDDRKRPNRPWQYEEDQDEEMEDGYFRRF